MTGRWLLVVVMVAGMFLSVASATSLGTFDDVPFSAMRENVTPCTAEADLVDPLGNVILLGGILSVLPVDEVALTELRGSCAGMVPVVVTIGDDGGGPGEVLDVLDFTGRTVLNGTDPVDLDVLLTDPLYSLLDGAVAVAEVRVAFCPEGNTCT